MIDISKFEAILTQSLPFANSDYIHQQMRAAFKRRLEEIGQQLPAAAWLLDRINRAAPQDEYKVLGDPAVRAVIQQALGQIVTDTPMILPLEQCERFLREAAVHLESGARSSPLESGAIKPSRLGSTSYTPWIWTTERSDDIFGQCFQKLVEAEYGESLCTPSSEDIEMLQKATRLLEKLFPLLSRSALSHAHLLAVFPGTGNWEKMASSSQFRLTGVIFLNKTTLKNPWWVAEHILHESLHQKLYDFRHAHSLLACDDPNVTDTSDDFRTVVSLWNTPGTEGANAWDPNRAIAAYHVYVHLAFFCSVAEERAFEFESDYGRLDVRPSMTPSRKAFERSRYLGENLRSSCWQDLGLGGQRLLDWFGSILDAVDPCPTPAGSYLHLILDRYLMEAAKVQRKPLPDNVARQLAALTKAEVRYTEALLKAMDIAPETIIWPDCSNLEQNAAFPQVRQTIATTILGLTTDGYSLRPAVWTGTKTPDEMVKEMVETSSLELAAMGAIEIPRRVRQIVATSQAGSGAGELCSVGAARA